MTVQAIYDQFQTPANLQIHMLRVAALAQIVLANWYGETINHRAILQACLLHDIAKPMMFDLSQQAQYGMSPSDIDKLAQLQDFLRQHYGAQEYAAAVTIVQEVGCEPLAIELVNNLEWEFIPSLLKRQDIQSLIPIYCDMRTAPDGLRNLKHRLDELAAREFSPVLIEQKQNGQELEKILQTKIKINLHDISPRQIEEQVDELRNFEI